MFTRRFVLATVAALIALTAPRTAAAQIEAHLANKTGIDTYNTFKDKSLWVTIYNQIHTIQMDYGCVKPGEVRRWTSKAAKSAATGGITVVVRGQLMETADCKGKEFCDTTMEVGKGTSSSIYMYTDQYKPDPKKCYWNKQEDRR